VANGVVYVGGLSDNVYALAAASGAVLWTYTTGSYVESAPSVANGVVYVGSADGNTYALNASSGTYLWSYYERSNPRSPVVADGVVYAGMNELYAFALP